MIDLGRIFFSACSRSSSLHRKPGSEIASGKDNLLSSGLVFHVGKLGANAVPVLGAITDRFRALNFRLMLILSLAVVLVIVYKKQKD